MTKHADSDLLVSLQEPEDHLAEVGSRVVAGRLVDLAHTVLGLCAEDDKVLAPLGFGAPWRKAVEARADDLSDAKGGRVLAQSEARPSGVAVASAIASVNQWLVRYGTVTKNAPASIRQAAPHVSAHEHSVKEVATELASLATFISNHAKETQAFGGGEGFAKQGHAIASELTTKRQTHVSATGKISPAVHALHVVEGAVYLELVRLSRAAHDALPHARAKLYALESVHPTRHAHHAVAAPPAASTPTASA
jgi:hypothetical protein